MAEKLKARLKKLAAQTAGRLNLPEQALLGGVELSLLCGELGHKLYISGHSGLITADESVAAFKTPNGGIRVIGSGLVIDAVSKTRAFVTGRD